MSLSHNLPKYTVGFSPPIAFNWWKITGDFRMSVSLSIEDTYFRRKQVVLLGVSIVIPVTAKGSFDSYFRCTTYIWSNETPSGGLTNIMISVQM